ncbi:uncharacterized protein LOC113213166 [Frankliniella occidentalis]|uniref:Uncharacterized protein LOC113213166 n=1 Tax=Frankliniella occidentalis TaxID=133901 RepID=A0A6J1T4Q9_FRAOC|nr:uncharacterized protein LOC113213166 [Frankliniella occidentalis]XP_052129206.1 uncharacterized protein LOC113213166 [Frankliniella occidentalis]
MEALGVAEMSSGQPAKVERANRISKMTELMDGACEGNERPQIILSTATIPIISKCFNEDLSFMLQVIPSDSNEADILEASQCSNGNSILVLKGASIFDEESYPYLVIQNSFLIKCVDLVQSLAAFISSFYVFGYSYKNEVKCTLEFIQRFLLNVSPEKGSKFPKRFTENVIAKVVNLSNELQSFNSPWALGF